MCIESSVTQHGYSPSSVASLTSDVIADVRELIMDPADTVTHDSFWTELIKETSVSQQKRLNNS